MKTALPFKSKPQQTTKLVGDERCGILEFPVYGSLLWHERQALREADGSFNMFKETAMTAGAIAKAEGRSDLRDLQMKILALLQVGMGINADIDDETLRIRVEHADILNELQVKVVEWNDRRQLMGVTALIQNRLPGFTDWDEIMVQRHITDELMVHLYDFLYSEENRQNRAQDEERTEVDEEELVGKSSGESGKSQKSPTGEESSGDSNSSTPDAMNSAGTSSEVSQSPESSTPMKEAKNKSAKPST